MSSPYTAIPTRRGYSTPETRYPRYTQRAPSTTIGMMAAALVLLGGILALLIWVGVRVGGNTTTSGAPSQKECTTDADCPP